MSQICHRYPVRLRTVVLVGSLVVVSRGVLFAASSPSFASGVEMGTVSASQIVEASGIVASRQNAGVLWTHNDSGYPGTAFAVATNGDFLGSYTVPGVYWGDFEDIAIGPGPSPDYQYVYLGDIGDNLASRPSIRVFRFPEPSAYSYQSASPFWTVALAADEIQLTYPDGAHNAEALMIDPWTGDLFIATKLTNSAGIYRATRAELESGAPVTLTFLREISFRSVSAGDISPDGRMLAVRRGSNADLWSRLPGQSVDDALGRNSVSIPVIGQPTEPNGEALGFDPLNSGYFTISEGTSQPLYYFARKDRGTPSPPAVLIPPGAVWRYQDTGADEGTAWREVAFEDSSWSSGAGQFGYGQGDEQTPLAGAQDPFARTITTYFRKSFTVSAPASLTNLALRVCFNEGIVVYLDGTEILRRNLPAGAGYLEPATSTNGDWQNIWQSFPVDPALLRAGTNVLAAEVHRYSTDGEQMSFDLQLIEGAVELPVRFTSLPELVGDSWRIDLAGPIGSLAVVEASADLHGWGMTGSVVLTNGVGVFEEPAVPGAGERFYRIRP